MAERMTPPAVPSRVHVVGVGGAGMSAVATVLVGMGARVSGSDLKDSPGLERLRSLGVEVHVGHSPENLSPDLDAVAISTAIPPSNPELVAARERGITVMRRAEVLGAIAATRSTVAVAGTHGKTTTSSMLTVVLGEAGLDPSFLIGAEVNEIGTGAAWTEGDLFVAEADESDGTFLEIPRTAAVVTNVEPDHLEFYGSVEALHRAFARFMAHTAGPVLVCADDEVARRLAAEVAGSAEVHTYGTSREAEMRMVDLRTGGRGSTFTLEREGRALGELSIPVAGAHNARNAAAAASMALLLGAPFEAARTALARFAGVPRRFEHRGQVGGVTFVDDYAHLPTEVSSALDAASDGDWDRVVAVFQPHRYSRTATVGPQFADAFEAADLLVVTDVYPAGELPRPGVSGKLVLDAVLDAHPRTAAAYLPRRADLVSYLSQRLRPGDVCVTLGAGDITSLPDEVAAALEGRAQGVRATEVTSTVGG